MHLPISFSAEIYYNSIIAEIIATVNRFAANSDFILILAEVLVLQCLIRLIIGLVTSSAISLLTAVQNLTSDIFLKSLDFSLNKSYNDCKRKLLPCLS
ncbi:MAG: hypothetical protein A2Y17_02210 [Clostridiales bacterium GWF2_38_85]|nr:MAG: hypothetical protein A2Y17_02210 [Clostridiales bacterium GWF2_38_85]